MAGLPGDNLTGQLFGRCKESDAMKKISQTYSGRMRTRMKELDLTLRALEKITGYSYEHLRKVRNGRSIQSREVSDRISEVLKLNPDEMWELAKVDKLKARYGEIPKELVAPADDRAKKYWSLLNKAEQEELLRIMEAMCLKRSLLERANSREEIVESLRELSEKLGNMESEAKHRRRAIQ